jgi:hypothetical protein
VTDADRAQSLQGLRKTVWLERAKLRELRARRGAARQIAGRARWSARRSSSAARLLPLAPRWRGSGPGLKRGAPSPASSQP